MATEISPAPASFLSVTRPPERNIAPLSAPLTQPLDDDGFDGDTQTDSLRELPDLQQALIDIDEELGEDDLEILKFLCRDHISVAKLDKAQSALEIFDILKKLLIIVENNQDFLLECLGRIHRFDLAKKLNLQPEAVRHHLSKFKQLTKFRTLLMDIIDDLDETEIEKVRFFLRGRIRKKPLTERRSLLQLFVFLEQECLLGENDVDLLIQIMESIKRGDLVDAILAYKGEPPKYGKNKAGLQPGTPYEGLPPGHELFVGTGSTDPKHNVGDYRAQNADIQRSVSAGTLSVSSEESARNSDRGVVGEPLLRQIANDLKSQVTDVGIELGFTNQELCDYEADIEDPYERTVKVLQDWQSRMRDKGQIPSRLIYMLNKLGFKQPAERLKMLIDSYNSSSGPSPQSPGYHVPMGPPEGSENHCASLREAIPFRDAAALHLELLQQQSRLQEQQQPFREDAAVHMELLRQQQILQEQQRLKTQEMLNGFQQLNLIGNLVPNERHCMMVNEVAVYNQGDRIVANAGVTQTLGVGQNLPPNVIPVSSELPAYRMDRRPRGWCVIINNERFSVDVGDPQAKEMPPRAGTESDAQSLQVVFERLGFIVRRYDNLKDTEMMNKLIDAAHNVDHTNFDCFVCCILTHGVLGHLYGSNGRLVSIKDLTATFQTNRCEALAGKPKLFFIQACQGRDKMEGGEIERDGPVAIPPDGLFRAPLDNDLSIDGKEMIPNEADFLLGYATVPGYVSFRSRNHGSWYIRKLCELLTKYADRYDLMSILVEVNREVAHANASLDGGLFKQIPAPFVTLRKQLFFR